MAAALSTRRGRPPPSSAPLPSLLSPRWATTVSASSTGSARSRFAVVHLQQQPPVQGPRLVVVPPDDASAGAARRGRERQPAHQPPPPGMAISTIDLRLPRLPSSQVEGKEARSRLMIPVVLDLSLLSGTTHEIKFTLAPVTIPDDVRLIAKTTVG